MYYLRKKLTKLGRHALGIRTYADRYDEIYNEIRRLRARRILEIGTNDGLNAVRMARAMHDGGHEIEYHGFDLFEQQGEAEFKREFSLRTRSLGEVRRHLRANGVNVARLVAGDSTVTLPREVPSLPVMDLIFIDGGHSVETVLADWTNVEPLVGPGTTVIFDDYPNWGVGPAVDSIDRVAWDVTILPTKDRFKVQRGKLGTADWMTFQLAMVRRRP